MTGAVTLAARSTFPCHLCLCLGGPEPLDAHRRRLQSCFLPSGGMLSKCPSPLITTTRTRIISGRSGLGFRSMSEETAGSILWSWGWGPSKTELVPRTGCSHPPGTVWAASLSFGVTSSASRSCQAHFPQSDQSQTHSCSIGTMALPHSDFILGAGK